MYNHCNQLNVFKQKMHDIKSKILIFPQLEFHPVVAATVSDWGYFFSCFYLCSANFGSA